MAKSDFPYLHGFSKTEQDRLRRQARFWEYSIFEGINLSSSRNLLEVGCGVGANTEILLRRYPDIHVTGIDINDAQISEAQSYLPSLPYAENRFKIEKMDAANMEYDSNTFDAAFLCWVLEHVPDPARVLSEIRRVMRPGSRLIANEVMNHTFFLEPYSPNVWKVWMAFNDFQYEHAGDPFVGAKLGNLLTAVGFRQVQTKIINLHLDNRNPGKRKEIIEFWTELLMSGRQALVDSELVTAQVFDQAMAELKIVRKDPNAVFMYSFMQSTGRVINEDN
jgi:ubiquinone/menaquinone biosynthesis C-methylase UbiE